MVVRFCKIVHLTKIGDFRHLQDPHPLVRRLQCRRLASHILRPVSPEPQVLIQPWNQLFSLDFFQDLLHVYKWFKKLIQSTFWPWFFSWTQLIEPKVGLFWKIVGLKNQFWKILDGLVWLLPRGPPCFSSCVSPVPPWTRPPTPRPWRPPRSWTLKLRGPLGASKNLRKRVEKVGKPVVWAVKSYKIYLIMNSHCDYMMAGQFFGFGSWY